MELGLLILFPECLTVIISTHPRYKGDFPNNLTFATTYYDNSVDKMASINNYKEEDEHNLNSKTQGVRNMKEKIIKRKIKPGKA